MGTEQKGLPPEITESDWYKELPVIDWTGMLEKHREKLTEIGVDLDSLDRKYFAFVATLMNGWGYYEKILSLEKIFEHLYEAWQTYEGCFSMGFGDMSMNVEIAVKRVRDELYPFGPYKLPPLL